MLRPFQHVQPDNETTHEHSSENPGYAYTIGKYFAFLSADG